ncbi:hypothetical protein EQ500_05645 [Lactobacillus sp. XV13L]|nr:hypothetical protein [Lactobacillus sp. XV13L]
MVLMSSALINKKLAAQRVLLAQDWSSWGDISLKSATTLFEVWGLPTVSLPVQLLAAHTGWSKQAPAVSLTSWLEATLQDWSDFSWRGICLGYLGSKALIDLWQAYLSRQARLVILDPAMADQGHLYHGLPPDYVEKFQELLPWADVLTPNVTEAQLLTGRSLNDDQSLQWALQELSGQMRGQQVVITSVRTADQIGCAYLEDQQLVKVMQPYYPRHLFGSGDLFTALLSLLLLANFQFAPAIRQAAYLTAQAVRQTAKSALDVELTAIIAPLLRLRGDSDE